MANKTITQLDAAQSLNDNMVIAVQDTNTTYKTTLADVKAYCGAGGSDNIGIPREIKNGVYQKPAENFTFSLPSDATDIGEEALASAFAECTNLTSVDLSSLTTVSGYQGLHGAFENCSNLTSVDLSSLTTVSGDGCFVAAFSYCTSLTSVSFPSLTTVSGNHALDLAFSYCKNLTSVDFPSLTTVNYEGLGNAFRDCKNLTTVDFPSLTTLSRWSLNGTFWGCTGLTDVYFRALTTSSFGSETDVFRDLMYKTGTTVTHTLHFPSNMESTISNLDTYPLFGGTDGYVVCVFDLPATE